MTIHGGSQVRRRDRIIGLWPTPGQLYTVQIPRTTSLRQGRLFTSGCGQRQEGEDEVGTDVADSGIG